MRPSLENKCNGKKTSAMFEDSEKTLSICQLAISLPTAHFRTSHVHSLCSIFRTSKCMHKLTSPRGFSTHVTRYSQIFHFFSFFSLTCQLCLTLAIVSPRYGGVAIIKADLDRNLIISRFFQNFNTGTNITRSNN